MSSPSFHPVLHRLWIPVLVYAVFLPLTTAATLFDHDRSGNLTAIRTAAAGPPVMVAPPSDQLVGVAGGWAAFSVVAGGPLPVTYQWKREGGANVAGGTGDTLYFPSVTPALEGRYYVVVTNARGSVTSAMARLFVDTNRNSLPDTWEMTYFGNLQQTGSGDFDGDGISNADEYDQGLNPALREIVYWVAASGDFSNPANWSRGRLPVEGDTAVINSGTFTLPASGTFRASRVTVNVPYTAPAGADVRLSLSGTWEFTQRFTLASGRRFAFDGAGAGAEVTLTGPVVLNSASLEVTGGAKVTVAGLASYAHPANQRVDWRAGGTDSLLVFSNLTGLTGPASAGGYLRLEASGGGTLSLPKLTSINKPADGTTRSDSGVWLYAANAGRVTAPLLAAFNDHDAAPDSRFQADGTGVLETPRLVAAKGASIDLNEASQPQRFTSLTNARSIVFHSGTGTPMVSALATISGLTDLEITRGVNVSFNSLSSTVSLTAIRINAGAKARFGALTGYTFPASLNEDIIWEVRDPGSLLECNSLTAITGPSSPRRYLKLQATAGGSLSLPKLASITKNADGTATTDSGIWLYAGNTGRLAAPLLTAFNDHDDGPNSRLHAENDGVLDVPRLLAVKGASLNLNEASQPQRFTSVTNARSIVFHSGTGTPLVSALASISGLTTLELNRGVSMSFDSLSSLTPLTEISVFSGAKARFGAVTRYAFPTGLNEDVLWEVRDADSVLEFTGLTTITGPPTARRYLTLRATAGGTLSLPNLTSITKPADGNTSADSGVRIDAQTTGAVSAPVLTAFRDNDTRPNSLITRGSTGVLALPVLGPTGITGVTLNGTTLPVLTAPLINTPTATAVTAIGAALGGTVTADGGTPVTERGVVYASNTVNRNPQIGGVGVTKVKTAGTTGPFSTPITGLTPATGYSFKAYAISSQGTRYTFTSSFTTRSALDIIGPAPPQLRKVGDRLEYSYSRKSAAAAAGATFQLQWSDNLKTWSTTGVQQSVISDDGTDQQVKATVPAGTTGTRFLRIQVTP